MMLPGLAISSARRMVAATVALALCMGSSAQAADKVRLILDWAWLPYHAAFLYARDRGYFTEAGLDVTIEQGRGSATSALMLAHGDFDLGHINITNAAQAIGKGLPLKTVAVYQHKTAAAFIGIKGKVKLTDAQSLKGLRVGSTPGGSDQFSLQVFSAVTKVEPSDMKIVSLNADAKNTALLTGTVDVISGDAPAFEAQVKAAGMEPEVLSIGDLGVPLIGFGFVANKAFLDKNGAAIPKFLRAARHGFADMAADPKAACEYMRVKVDALTPEQSCLIYLAGMARLSTPPTDPSWGHQTDEEWTKLVGALRAIGQIPDGMEPSAFYTHEFEP
ncbi:MAG TPA: ABC transporter substrate-binding protein [Stellaceae bacterium]|jgi:NitT/TauT family transport system substrate-binding protein|nr:ABC transporter substrate-binding protein [Stellaceae bacterium]